MSAQRSPRITLAVLGGVALAAVGLLTQFAAPAPSASGDSHRKATSAPRTGLGLIVTPLPDWFTFQSSDTVNGWIDALDNKSITAHAWELWGALTTLTDQELNGQKVPIYETWWDAQEALAPPAVAPAVRARLKRGRQFERPRQLEHPELPRAAAVPGRPPFLLFDIVKYNNDIKQFIDKNKYNDHAELDKINNGWGNSKPIADRKLLDFPNTSVMLKPVYEFVSGSSATILPYWAGPANSTNPQAPDESTWTKQMVIIPPSLGVDLKKFSLKAREEFLPAVPVSAFYNIKLTKDEADSVNSAFGLQLKEGDYALLIGMHVSSREIDNWTWQTFWWSLSKPTIPDSVKGRVQTPFDHYQVAVGYSFLTAPNNPNSLPVVCYNPYLEAGFDNTVFVRPGQLGIESNCMSCHRCAAWPARSTQQPKRHYVANGLIDPGDPDLFAGKTKTDFLWGVADGRNPPAPPTPAPRPSATPRPATKPNK